MFVGFAFKLMISVINLNVLTFKTERHLHNIAPVLNIIKSAPWFVTEFMYQVYWKTTQLNKRKK
jgi:hypothetical protein